MWRYGRHAEVEECATVKEEEEVRDGKGGGGGGRESGRGCMRGGGGCMRGGGGCMRRCMRELEEGVEEGGGVRGQGRVG